MLHFTRLNNTTPTSAFQGPFGFLLLKLIKTDFTASPLSAHRAYVRKILRNIETGVGGWVGGCPPKFWVYKAF